MTAANLPSHLTQAQAARFLGWTRQEVYRRTGKGRELEAEWILGIYMIARERVLAVKAQVKP